MRLARPDAPLAALRAATLARAVRRLTKLLGAGAPPRDAGASLAEAWSDVTLETSACPSAALGPDEIASLAALIRNHTGGAQPVVLVHALVWQSPERRAQVASHPKLLTALLHRAASFADDEDGAAVAAMALGELCRPDGGAGACYVDEVLAAPVDEEHGGSALAALCRVIAARHPNRLLTGSALSAICDAARTCRGSRFEIARQEGLLEGLAWCLETDGGLDADDAPQIDQGPDRDQIGNAAAGDDDDDPALILPQDVRAAAAWAVEALAQEPEIAAAAAKVSGMAGGLAHAAARAELAAEEAEAALALLRAAGSGGSCAAGFCSGSGSNAGGAEGQDAP